MPERYEKALRLLCIVLAGVLLFQLSRTVFRRSPLERLSIPAVPTLAGDTNAPAGGKGTNSAAAQAAGKAGTNNVAASEPAGKGTNLMVAGGSKTNTNAASALKTGTNMTVVMMAGTNATNLAKAASNTEPSTAVMTNSTNSTLSATIVTNGTNAHLQLEDAIATTNGTNRVVSKNSTNGPPNLAATNAAATNLAAAKPPRKSARGPGGPGGANSAADLPLTIQVRIDKITQSEILGQVMHPMPMGLLGIAGKTAFIRSPDGQTGLVKEGDSLGSLKLVKIGINRVLVEQDGQQSELTIFSGYGSDSLLPKSQDKDNPK